MDQLKFRRAVVYGLRLDSSFSLIDRAAQACNACDVTHFVDQIQVYEAIKAGRIPDAPTSRWIVDLRAVSLLTKSVVIEANTEDDARTEALRQARHHGLYWWTESDPEDIQIESISHEP